MKKKTKTKLNNLTNYYEIHIKVLISLQDFCNFCKEIYYTLSNVNMKK